VDPGGPAAIRASGLMPRDGQFPGFSLAKRQLLRGSRAFSAPPPRVPSPSSPACTHRRIENRAPRLAPGGRSGGTQGRAEHPGSRRLVPQPWPVNPRRAVLGRDARPWIFLPSAGSAGLIETPGPGPIRSHRGPSRQEPSCGPGPGSSPRGVVPPTTIYCLCLSRALASRCGPHSCPAPQGPVPSSSPRVPPRDKAPPNVVNPSQPRSLRRRLAALPGPAGP